MRVVFSIIGAVLGLSLASGSHELFGLLLGGCAGLGIAELGALRVRLKELEDEVGALRKVVVLQPRRDTEGQQGAAPQSVGSTSPPPGSPRAQAADTASSQPDSPWAQAAGTTSSQAAPSPPATEPGASGEPAPGAWEPYAAAGRPAARAASATARSGGGGIDAV